MRWLVFLSMNVMICVPFTILFSHIFMHTNIFIFIFKKSKDNLCNRRFYDEKFFIFLLKGNWKSCHQLENCDDEKFSAKGQTDLKLDAISLNLNPINLCTSNSITENCFRLFVWVKEKLSFLDYSMKSILSTTVEKVINKNTCNVEQFYMLTICLESF